MARLAGDLINSMPFRCFVEEKQLVSDGHAGKQGEWAATTQEALPCNYLPESGSAHVEGDVPKSKTVVTVILKAGAGVTGSMRIRLLAHAGEPERLIEVKNVLPADGVLVQVVGLTNI
ncbi:MAG TPA: hypothetical protein VF654_17505 [Pyrinomonadaceae bacterium]|jgi:hypothetical protein